jgi:7-cyano-7-deazaguanine synthase
MMANEVLEKIFGRGGQEPSAPAPSAKPSPPTPYGLHLVGAVGSQGPDFANPGKGLGGGPGGKAGSELPGPPPTTGSCKPLAVVLLSGGLDSCVAAAVARQDFELALFHANYGQRTLARELAAFRALAAFFGARLTLEADFNFLGQIGGSSLTDTHIAVPTDEAEPPGIPSTYVPFRNSVFLSGAVAWAEALGAGAVFIGANFLDNPGYPDCRPEYFAAFNRLIDLGTRPETAIRIHTPLIGLDKGGIIRLGLKLGAPLELTWSCYTEETRACGRCSSCRLRLEGFAAAGVPDPIPYQE